MAGTKPNKRRLPSGDLRAVGALLPTGHDGAQTLKALASLASGDETPIRINRLHRTQLTRVALRWHASVATERVEKMHRAILEAFYAWRDGQADSDGNITVESQMGLFPTTVRTVPVHELQPNQCAGPYVRDDIALAFKLAGEGYSQFIDVVAEYGMYEVFAFIALCSWLDADPSSLIRVNAFLVDGVLFDLKVTNDAGRGLFNELRERDKKERERAAKARIAKSREATSRRARGLDMKSQCRKAAIDYFMSNPAATDTQMQAVVAPRVKRSIHTVATYTRGTKQEALMLLNTRGSGKF